MQRKTNYKLFKATIDFQNNGMTIFNKKLLQLFI